MLHLPRGHSHPGPARGGGISRRVARYFVSAKPQRRIWLALLLASGLLAAEPGEPYHVTAVRFWSLGDVTRIVVETDGDFQVRSDRLSNPERIFFDLTGTEPLLGQKRVSVIPVDDKLVQQIRVGKHDENVTRVVLDLAGSVEATTSRLRSPSRLIIELRREGQANAEAMRRRPAIEAPVRESGEGEFAPEDTPAPVHKTVEYRPFKMPASNPASKQALRSIDALLVQPPRMSFLSADASALSPKLSPMVYRANTAPLLTKVNVPPPAAPEPVVPPVPETVARTPVLPPASEKSASAATPEIALPAKHDSLGAQSMIRVLGLKVGRIVLDPGHGGHDTGTIGPKGLREKDLVLDIAQRLGALLQDRLGAEVIYTRSDDTFIPLERRTEIANEAKADLFLSIHANSSPIRSIAGVETYYLNFTTSRTALDLAQRENAGSQKTIFELQDLLEKIALKNKVEESREFATRIQSALFALSSKTDSRAKDRGVRRAPFVVLIGASMPSVLAEIGFISNAHDESIMKREDYRDRVAEALYKGVSSYANTLSHFQVAQRH